MSQPTTSNANGASSASNLGFSHGIPLARLPLDPNKVDDGFRHYESAEHSFLGDAILLQWSDQKSYLAQKQPFTLSNGLKLTYGQINALAGDYYGTINPISNGKTLDQQKQYFTDAWNTLATDKTRQPSEANDIIKTMQGEVDTVNQAVRYHELVSEAYSKISDPSLSLQARTLLRPSNMPSYLGLAAINFDHFGDDARTAYNAGHLLALTKAAGGSNQDLADAYALNAFADHFLEDAFSAGHLRTPRRLLHSTIDPLKSADICAEFMHAEDNAIGLDCKNPAGTSFTVFGDKMLMHPDNALTMELCLQAVQASADEVYAAWKARKAPATATGFAAWNLAPTLESARGQQNLAPLFQYGVDGPPLRADISKRTEWKFTTNYTFFGTRAWLDTSSLWNYPMKLDSSDS